MLPGLLTVCLIALTLPIGPAAAVETMTFIVEKNVSVPDDPAQNQTGEKQTVLLEPARFIVASDDQTEIVDFAREIIVYINHIDRTVYKTSLYWFPAFQAYEKQNRIALGRLAEQVEGGAGGESGLKTRLIDLEMIFGQTRNSPIEGEINIESTDASGQLIYEGEALATYRLPAQAADRTRVPQVLLPTYGKYLLYKHRAHPRLERRLFDTEMLFSSLQYENREKPQPTWTFQYTLSETDAPFKWQDVAEQARTYKTIEAGSERLSAIIEASRVSPSPTLEDNAKTVQQVASGGDPLTTYLSFIAMMLQHGQDKASALDPKVLEDVQRVVGNIGRENFQRLNNAIGNQSSPGASEQAITVLEEIRDNVRQGGGVLNVFIGNHHAALRRYDLAVDHIMRALEAYPHLTSAYWDLGDHLFKLYQMPDAWAAWTHMREINPTHPMIVQIDRLEENIRNTLPEYFLQ